VLIAGLAVQACAIVSYLMVNRLGQFYALSLIFGTAYGGVMPLYAVLAREYFGQRIMGTLFGAATMVSSLGMAFDPWAGGWVFDTFNSYAWLYVGSFGLGAAAVALAFPSRPRAARAPQARAQASAGASCCVRRLRTRTICQPSRSSTRETARSKRAR